MVCLTSHTKGIAFALVTTGIKSPDRDILLSSGTGYINKHPNMMRTLKRGLEALTCLQSSNTLCTHPIIIM